MTDRSPTRLLVVDGEPAARERVRSFLEEHGYQVLEAENGRVGLEVWEREKPDLVLLELSLPEADGLDVLARMTQGAPETPVVVVSGTEAVADIVEAFRRGAWDCLLKPIEELSALPETLGKALERAGLRHRPRELPAPVHDDPLDSRLLESEERFSKAFQSHAALMAISTPAEGRFLEVNDAFLTTLGFDREDVIGKTSRELGLFADIGQRDRIIRIVREKGYARNVEVTVRTKRGELRHGAFSADIIRMHDEAYLFTVMNDVTEKRKLEEQLRQKHKMESIGRLAGSVAHDFNNLLFPILGYSEMLLHEIPADDRRHAKVVEIRKTAERARELTRQLLAFSRKQVLEIKTVNPCQVVSEFERILRRTIREDIELRTFLASCGNIKADISQVEQVLMNLVVNAQDAMPYGGKLLIETADVVLDEKYIENHPDSRPGPHVMLAISDTGIGMDRETLKFVFEPFFTTRTGKGTGLGLATVHGIVKQHGGSISVDSKPGQGTTVRINFPRVDAVVESAPAPGSRPRARFGSETVLVVEDDQAVRKLVCTILEQHGYHTLDAGDPEGCLHRIGQHEGSIHLLLTDVVLPQQNGRELYEQLRRFLPNLKVLYLSGYASEVISHHGVVEEDVDFISKPVSVEDLTGKVREILDR